MEKEDASSVTTAPPREWPTRRIGGREGQWRVDLVRVRMVRRSRARVGRVRSSEALAFGSASSVVSGEGLVVVVSPCPRASMERMPAEGRRFLISAERTAKERPEDPAPWWVTKRGPGDLPGPEEGAGEVR